MGVDLIATVVHQTRQIRCSPTRWHWRIARRVWG